MSTASYVEKDAALERRFQKVLVGEPTVEDTIAILRGLQGALRSAPQRGRSPTPPMVAAATLSHRYITDRQLPDKAIDLIDEAASTHSHGDRLQARGLWTSLERRLIQLKIESRGLEARKKDDVSRCKPPR